MIRKIDENDLRVSVWSHRARLASKAGDLVVGEGLADQSRLLKSVEIPTLLGRSMRVNEARVGSMDQY